VATLPTFRDATSAAVCLLPIDKTISSVIAMEKTATEDITK